MQLERFRLYEGLYTRLGSPGASLLYRPFAHSMFASAWDPMHGMWIVGDGACDCIALHPSSSAHRLIKFHAEGGRRRRRFLAWRLAVEAAGLSAVARNPYDALGVFGWPVEADS